MAYTFPMPLADFFNHIPIASASFGLGEAMEYAETVGGEILTAELGNRLWKAEITVAPNRYAPVEQVKARLNVLRYPGRSLLVHSMPLVAPQYDPDGSILGASTVRLANVYSNNREIRLSGLPNGYILQYGDFIGWQYGSNPTRYALHQVANKVTAAGGIADRVEVTPFIESGWVANQTVTLIKPVMKAIVIPGSTDVGSFGAQIADGVKFTVYQTFR